METSNYTRITVDKDLVNAQFIDKYGLVCEYIGDTVIVYCNIKIFSDKPVSTEATNLLPFLPLLRYNLYICIGSTKEIKNILNHYLNAVRNNLETHFLFSCVPGYNIEDYPIVVDKIAIDYHHIHLSNRVDLEDKTDKNIIEQMIKSYYSVLPDIKTRYEQKIIEKKTQALKELVSTISKRRIIALKETIAEQNKNVERAEEALRRSYMTIREAEMMLEQYKLSEPNADKQVEYIFNKYPNLQVSDYALTIDTDTINISGVNIGKFRITININDNRIKVRNLTRRISDIYDHPHVKNEEFCLGNMKIEVQRLLSNCLYFELIDFIVELLHYYNEKDCYSSLHRWNTKEDEDANN